jgi:hypothetical protein
MVKFPCKVYTYKEGYDIYDLTLARLETHCCIYGTNLYWSASIPKEEEYLVNTFRPSLYDIYNYECCEWWEWPDELKKYVEDAKAERLAHTYS